jgi:WD40 repeat protein
VPILAEQCLECHRADKAKGSYRLDTFERLGKAGDSESPPIRPGHAEESLLYQLLITTDEGDRMPKKADPLPAKDIALIRQWLDEGAKFDGGDARAPLADLVQRERPQIPEKYPRPLPVTAMAVNGDGKVLAASGYHEVLLWDTATGALKGRVQDLPERVLGLSFIRGGPWLAVAGGTPGRSGEVWLVDVTKPAERKRLAGLRDCALCAVTTPDGARLITGGADNRVRCFSLPDGKALWNIEMHADWVLALAVSRDGKHIATGGRDRTARCIETATGVVEGTFTGHSVPVLSVAFSPDGLEVMSGGADGEARRWGLDGTGKKDTTVRAGGRSEVLGLAYVEQDIALAATALGTVHTLDLKERKVQSPLVTHEDRVNALLLFSSGNERRLFTASHDGQIRVSSVEDGKAKELVKFSASPGW